MLDVQRHARDALLVVPEEGGLRCEATMLMVPETLMVPCLTAHLQVVHEKLNIKHGCITTIHNITNTQVRFHVLLGKWATATTTTTTRHHAQRKQCGPVLCCPMMLSLCHVCTDRGGRRQLQEGRPAPRQVRHRRPCIPPGCAPGSTPAGT